LEISSTRDPGGVTIGRAPRSTMPHACRRKGWARLPAGRDDAL